MQSTTTITFNAASKSYSSPVQYWDTTKKVWLDSTLTLNLNVTPANITYTTPLIGIGAFQIPKKNVLALDFLASPRQVLSWDNQGKNVLAVDNGILSKNFACRSSEDVYKWLSLMQFALDRNLVAKVHPHPLSFQNVKKLYLGCNYCADRSVLAYLTCEYCDNFQSCRTCQPTALKLTNKSPAKPRHYKPADHQHVLSYFESIDPDWFGPQYKSGYTCQTCHVKYATTTELFHCLDCKDYNECADCVWNKETKDRTARNGTELVLDRGFLEKMFHVAKQGGAYSLVPKTSKRPNKLSLITGKHWDLTEIERQPVPTAYFEVKFHSFDTLKRVGIGIGNQIFVQHELLGCQQNSFAWYNNGQICHNAEDNLLEVFARFRPGDTVGAGILYDSFNTRRLYFTKNGKLVMTYLDPVPRGMDCFPGITCTDDADVSFSVNFVGPFLFDTGEIPDYSQAPKHCYINELPREILATILSESNMARVWKEQQPVCQSWKHAWDDNIIWSRMFLERWPHQNPNLKIKYWKKFYLDRVKAQKTQFGEELSPIENCAFQFQCPLVWANMTPVQEQDSTRFCNKCEKHVYRVTTKEQLQSHVAQGHCVSFSTMVWNPDRVLIRGVELENLEIREVGGMMF